MSANLCTHDEATKRLCPFLTHSWVRDLHGGGQLAVSSGLTIDATANACLGRQCMMWTWAAGSTTHGYCGLRGKVVIP